MRICKCSSNRRMNLQTFSNRRCGGQQLAHLTLLPCLLLVAGVANAATITIDASQTYQTIEGFGVNANHRSWNNDLKPVLDQLIDDAGMTHFRVVLDNADWETNNDNGDSRVMNWAYYQTVYSSPEFQKLWGLMAYLNQKGLTNGVMPNFQGF